MGAQGGHERHKEWSNLKSDLEISFLVENQRFLMCHTSKVEKKFFLYENDRFLDPGTARTCPIPKILLSDLLLDEPNRLIYNTWYLRLTDIEIPLTEVSDILTS